VKNGSEQSESGYMEATSQASTLLVQDNQR
jgi:hypothetical protein